jgi:hypothetical protein
LCQAFDFVCFFAQPLKRVESPLFRKVTDNAANMQAGISATEGGLLSLRCLAHSLQLVVNDAFSADGSPYVQH